MGSPLQYKREAGSPVRANDKYKIPNFSMTINRLMIDLTPELGILRIVFTRVFKLADTCALGMTIIHHSIELISNYSTGSVRIHGETL